MSIKEFAKTHKKEIVIAGAYVLVIVAGVVIYKTKVSPKLAAGLPTNFAANEAMESVELTLGEGAKRDILWVWTLPEAIERLEEFTQAVKAVKEVAHV